MKRLERSDIRGQKEGVVQGREWGRSDIRRLKEGVVHGRYWGQVTLDDRRE